MVSQVKAQKPLEPLAAEVGQAAHRAALAAGMGIKVSGLQAARAVPRVANWLGWAMAIATWLLLFMDSETCQKLGHVILFLKVFDICV